MRLTFRQVHVRGIHEKRVSSNDTHEGCSTRSGRLRAQSGYSPSVPSCLSRRRRRPLSVRACRRPFSRRRSSVRPSRCVRPVVDIVVFCPSVLSPVPSSSIYIIILIELRMRATLPIYRSSSSFWQPQEIKIIPTKNIIFFRI